MRIISKFHDYYDSAMSHGQDRSVVFIRNSEIQKPPVPISGMNIKSPRIHKNETFKIFYGVIGFCGKTYPFARFEEDYFENDIYHSIRDYAYSYEEYKILCEEYGVTQGKWEGNTTSNFFRQQNFEDFMISQKLAIFSYEHTSDSLGMRAPIYTVNPILRPYQFYRIFDPYSAFQELDMWIGGVLPQSENMTDVVSDKYRIEQHGYDKHSFRNLPNPRKTSKIRR